MHIITGLIVAGLAGRKKKKSQPSSLPRFLNGPVETAHWLPGRVRFRVKSLADNEMGKKRLLEALPSLDGVESVEVNSLSGSVLIHYREDTVKPDLLFAAVVRILGLEKELEQIPQPVITRELRELVGCMNRAVYESTGGLLDFWSASLILLAAVGTRQILTEGARALPAGFTLIWWAANSLLNRRAD